jgi:hypothetical protein
LNVTETAGAIVVFSLFVAILSRLTGLLSILLAWFSGIAFAIFSSLLFIQGMLSNPLTPPVPTAYCLTKFWTSECNQVVASAATEVSALPEVTVPVSSRDASIQNDRNETTVYIQFAGFAREVVQGLAEKLVAAGWNVPDASRGGERLQSAQVHMEIRFFRAADQDAAILLARDMLDSGYNLQVKDLSSTELADQVSRSLLEIWFHE